MHFVTIEGHIAGRESVKKLLIAVLVLVLLYPLLPWVLGRTIEQRVGAYTDQLQDQMPYMTIVQTHFTRGWFSSDQDITIGGAGPVTGTPGSQLTIHNVIHHGPICGLGCIGLAHVETHFVWPAAAQASVTKVFGQAEPVTIQTRLHLLGGITTTLASPPLADVVVDADTHLTSSGFTFTIDQGAAADKLSMHGELPKISYRGGKLELELDGAAFASHSQRLLRSLYRGESVFALPKLAATGPQGSVTIDDVHLTTRSSDAVGFYTLSVQIGSGAIVTQPLTLTSTDFDFSYRHLPTDALESLIAALGAVNHDGATAPVERAAKLTAVLRDKAPPLLLQQPEFTLDRFRLRDAAGGLLVTGSVRLVGFVAADLAPDADPKALLRRVRVAIDLSGELAFLESLPNGATLSAQVQSFAQQGLATVDKGHFHSKVEFADGKLTFDGQPAPMGPGAALPGAPPAPPAVAPPANAPHPTLPRAPRASRPLTTT